MAEIKISSACSCKINCEFPRSIDTQFFGLSTISESGSCGIDCAFDVYDEFGCLSYYEKKIFSSSCHQRYRIRDESELEPCCFTEEGCPPQNNEDCRICILETECGFSYSGPFPKYSNLIDAFDCIALGEPTFDPENNSASSVAYYFASQNGATETAVKYNFYLDVVPTTCYLKVWLKEKTTYYKIDQSGCGDTYEEVSTIYTPAETIEITPDMLVNNDGFCLANLMDFFSEENSPSNYLGTVFEKEVFAPTVNSSRELRVWKWSFVPDYEPDDGPDSYPFENLDAVRKNGDGYPASNRQDSPYYTPVNPPSDNE